MLTGTAAINGSGNALTNTIIGNSGANVIEGKGGADVLDGGAGVDTLSYASSLLGVTVALNGATVSIGAGGDAEGDSFKNFENISGSALADTLTGDKGGNRLDGGAGADAMAGGLGNDIYVVDNFGDSVTEGLKGGTDQVEVRVSYTLGENVEKLVLLGAENLSGSGNALANTLTGNAGNNLLDGKAGADTLIGGLGDDTYVVDLATDKVIELAGQGVDTIITSLASFSLSGGVSTSKKKPAPAGLSAIENLTYDNGLADDQNATLTGNALANVITGGSGYDKLDGKGGADTLMGKAGDDTYLVDNLGDIIDESTGYGNDLVQSAVSFDLSDTAHAQGEIERLMLTGTAAINGTGNALANTIVGNAGANLIEGKEGNDILTGGNGNDQFIFTDDGLAGPLGNDVITDFKGGAGLRDVLILDDNWGFATAADAIAAFQTIGLDKVLTLDANTSITLLGKATMVFNEDDVRIV